MKKITRRAALLGLLLSVSACQGLDVTDPMNPDQKRALQDPAAVETLIGQSWKAAWTAIHGSNYAANAFPTIADEMTSTYDGYGQIELAALPRQPFDNTPETPSHDVGQDQWKNWFEALSSANEALGAIDRGLVIRTGGADHTTRARAFAKLMQGVSLGYLGELFDKAYIVDEHSPLIEDPEAPLPPYSTYTEMQVAAIASLEEAIAIADTASFTLPETWITGQSLTSEQLVRMAHSYIARFLVYTARTPEERAAVDWEEVKRQVEQGITEDVGPTIIDFNNPGYSQYWRYAQYGFTSGPERADYRLIGPADVSGNYQTWLETPPEDRARFDITTPDRRITGADGPQSDGKYFRYMANDAGFDISYGGYRMSAYQWYRYGGRYSSGFVPFMSVDEMRLLEAEAELRLDHPDVAADLINVTRVANGELPPVDADGVPESADCVPRRDDGSCGDLLDALMYERSIELAGLEATRAYLDRRGFGTLAEGTFLQLPVPGEELQLIGEPIYTFGGVGDEWGAR